MRHLIKTAMPTLFRVTLLLSLAVSVQAQSSPTAGQPTGSIAGQVLIEGKPAVEALVVLRQGRRGQNQASLGIKAISDRRVVSDREGNFKFENVPAGDYLMNAMVPGFINDDPAFSREGRSIAVDDGEAVTGIELPLRRGALITGRITDANGAPLIEAFVHLWMIDKQGNENQISATIPSTYISMNMTDDQGVYRLYGLPAGRYKVSVGQNEKWAYINGQGADIYMQTFHPDVIEQAKARVIELGQGEEANNIDIRLSRRLQSYTARGRLVEAESGKPVARKAIRVALVNERGEYQGNKPYDNLSSSERGEFRIAGLTSGSYMVYCYDGSDTYCEPSIFEINDADVTGIELKVSRAASLSGRVVIEGASASQISALAQTVQIFVGVQPYRYSFMPARVAADGTFKIGGLAAGVAHLNVNDLKATGLAIVGIERDGEALRELTLKEGEELKGIRVMMAYGTGIIRGTLRAATGKPPADVHVTVQAYRLGKERTYVDSVEVDGLGRFVFHGLTPGDYELLFYTSRNGVAIPIKTVSISNGAETMVDFVVDFDAKDKRSQER
jgi:protocatechuate 3,4-dioxygenase beta subunit